MGDTRMPHLGYSAYFLASVLRGLRKRLTVLHMNHAGTAIKAMRLAQSMSLRELARLAEVEPGYLSLVERGLREPSPRWLASVTNALGRHLAGDVA